MVQYLGNTSIQYGQSKVTSLIVRAAGKWGQPPLILGIAGMI